MARTKRTAPRFTTPAVSPDTARRLQAVPDRCLGLQSPPAAEWK
jgi:hypothetical protein